MTISQKVSIGSCHSPYRLSWIPLACTCNYSIAKKVLQLIHNIDCRIVERQFILISIFGARPKSCTNLLCFVQRQAIYFCVWHTKVASHYHIWHDFVIPTRQNQGYNANGYLKKKAFWNCERFLKVRLRFIS
jgi:hypothetical protein